MCAIYLHFVACNAPQQLLQSVLRLSVPVSGHTRIVKTSNNVLKTITVQFVEITVTAPAALVASSAADHVQVDSSVVQSLDRTIRFDNRLI